MVMNGSLASVALFVLTSAALSSGPRPTPGSGVSEPASARGDTLFSLEAGPLQLHLQVIDSNHSASRLILSVDFRFDILKDRS
jgi:hypothetical protein